MALSVSGGPGDLYAYNVFWQITFRHGTELKQYVQVLRSQQKKVIFKH